MDGGMTYGNAQEPVKLICVESLEEHMLRVNFVPTLGFCLNAAVFVSGKALAAGVCRRITRG